MEYVFGTQGEREVLKTKGDTHTDLSGFQEVVREYPGEKITDNFRVVRKTSSGEDVEGNCYDWYEIDRHYRTVDKTGPLINQAQDTDAILVDQEYRLTLLELGLNVDAKGE